MNREDLMPGLRVRVKSMRRSGELIEGPDRSGQCLVALGSLKLRVRTDDLEQVEQPQAKSPAAAPKRRPAHHDGSSLRLDLHGRTTKEAVDLLEKTLDRALIDVCSSIEVIHGVGTGAVKKAVLAYLQGSKHVERIVPDPQNPGTTWVYL